MRQRGLRASRRAARESKDRYRVGVDELARRAAAGLDLWTGEPLAGRDGPEGAAGRRWTAEEDAMVRVMPPEQVAAWTGRSLAAVWRRRRALGVSCEAFRDAEGK
jgi:hypothetical protein